MGSQLVQLYQQACYASSSASSAIRQELGSSAALPLALLAPTEAHIRDDSGHTAASAAARISSSSAGLPVMLHRQSLALQCMASRSSGALGGFAGTPSSGLVGGGLGGSAGELEQALADVLDSAAGSDTVAALRCPQALYTGALRWPCMLLSCLHVHAAYICTAAIAGIALNRCIMDLPGDHRGCLHPGAVWFLSADVPCRPMLE